MPLAFLIQLDVVCFVHQEIEQYLDSGGTSFEAVRSDDIDMSAIRDKMTSPTDLLMYGTSPGFQHNQHDVSCSNSQK